MSWTKLEPVVVSSGKPMVSISLKNYKNVGLRGRLTLADTFLPDAMPETCDIEIGEDGEFAEHLRVTFIYMGKGAFEIVRNPNGGARIILPPLACAPQKDFGILPCKVVQSIEDGCFIIKLPTEDWFRAKSVAEVVPVKRLVEKVQEKARTPVAAEEPTARLPRGGGTETANERINVTNYLTKKGHTVRKNNVGHYVVNDEEKTMVDIVEMINGYRDPLGLPPITERNLQHV